MAEITLAHEPLICTPEIAKTIFTELTLGGRAQATNEVAFVGALWQRKRIVLHLEAELQKVQALLAEMDKTSAEYVKNGGDPFKIPSVRISIRGELEGKKSLLQELISALK